ncbi:unnamed protein product [Chondrus crispus]|uniref:Uncharacterized protein n=1 Tax=Chondrus crispus TaxID=2769 RepID=R7QFY6_CHOCR|nr:unnamed protein product [Chondrus crispus]CDF36678.1 unnamed protein product [Chondrus crispus]|eukprot:XP_005716497.1 unnamed protein product [Chondrus crispus]
MKESPHTAETKARRFLHFTLFQALHGAFARMYWEKREWDRQPNPTDHTLRDYCNI